VEWPGGRAAAFLVSDAEVIIDYDATSFVG
jgi:hypothetical protein